MLNISVYFAFLSLLTVKYRSIKSDKTPVYFTGWRSESLKAIIQKDRRPLLCAKKA